MRGWGRGWGRGWMGACVRACVWVRAWVRGCVGACVRRVGAFPAPTVYSRRSPRPRVLRPRLPLPRPNRYAYHQTRGDGDVPEGVDEVGVVFAGGEAPHHLSGFRETVRTNCGRVVDGNDGGGHDFAPFASARTRPIPDEQLAQNYGLHCAYSGAYYGMRWNLIRSDARCDAARDELKA